MLRYLDKSLGKSFSNLGVCLAAAGVVMYISIAFTILLNLLLSSLKKGD
jgi:hypothetical protein